MQPPDATLTPPLALRDTLHTLREIIGVYTTSLVDEADREVDFATVLDKAVSPAVEMCERMGDMRRANTSGTPSTSAGGDGAEGGPRVYSQGEWERDVFMINCLGYLEVRSRSSKRAEHLRMVLRIRASVMMCQCAQGSDVQNSLQDYPFTTARLDELEDRVDKHVESMTYEHVSLVTKSDLCPQPSRHQVAATDSSARQASGRVRPGTHHAHHSDQTRRRECCSHPPICQPSQLRLHTTRDRS